MAKVNLVSDAKAFVRSHPRRNPVDISQETRFNQYIVTLKERGLRTSDWSEGVWFQAAREFGFHEEEIGSLMEQVAAWGVDD